MNATLHFLDKNGQAKSVQANAVRMTMDCGAVTYELDNPIECSQAMGQIELRITGGPTKRFMRFLLRPMRLRRQHIAKARGKNWRSAR